MNANISEISTPVKLALCCYHRDLPESSKSSHHLVIQPLLDTFWQTPTFLIDRKVCEHDENTRQLIPYIVLYNPKNQTFFTYSRGNGSAESRLLGNLSLGLGGHIDSAIPENTSLSSWCALEARRELQEEVGISLEDDLAINFQGLISDNTTDVGLVHIGLLTIVDVDPEIINTFEDSVIEHGKWLTRGELQNTFGRLENWSQAVFATVIKNGHPDTFVNFKIN